MLNIHIMSTYGQLYVCCPMSRCVCMSKCVFEWYGQLNGMDSLFLMVWTVLNGMDNICCVYCVQIWSKSVQSLRRYLITDGQPANYSNIQSPPIFWSSSAGISPTPVALFLGTFFYSLSDFFRYLHWPYTRQISVLPNDSDWITIYSPVGNVGIFFTETKTRDILFLEL